MSFRDEAAAAAVHWKHNTMLLPAAARGPGPVKHRGSYDWCLPERYAHLNVLPDALWSFGWFRTAAIAWHDSIDGGPNNHLLSSQVQCVNALTPMAFNPDAIRRTFSGVLDMAEPLAVGTPEAPDALVAFEWIGHDDPLGEWRGGPGHRGTNNTSVDAVIRYRTSTGDEELALIEWKYTEDYRDETYNAAKLPLRLRNYRRFLDDPDSPIRHDVHHADLIRDPVYQLMRLQLLAWQTERRDSTLSAVRVVLCAPGRNNGVHEALPDRLLASAPYPVCDATNLVELWTGLLTRPDRFVYLDTAVFAESDAATSEEFRFRYGHLADNGDDPVRAIAVCRHGYSWRAATLLYRENGGPVQVLDPWVEPLGFSAGGTLESEWDYLDERVCDGSGGNGYSYEIDAGGFTTLDELQRWAAGIDADAEASAPPLNPPWQPQPIENASWEAAARLTRRHPQLLLFESHQGGGTADALTFVDRDRPDWSRCISLNREGSAHISPFTTTGSNTKRWPTLWAAWIADPDRALLELESRAVLRTPTSPAPTIAAACYRLMANTITAAGEQSRWEWRNGMEDTSGYGGGVREHHFRSFEDAKARLGEREPDDLYDNPAYRFWFLLKDGDPLACIETVGTLWTSSDETHHISAPVADDSAAIAALVQEILG